MDQARALTLLTTVGVRAVKTFTRKADGTIDEEGYGRARKFTAREIAIDEAGRWLEKLGPRSNSCVVLGETVDWAVGEVKRRLSSERDGDAPTIRDVPRLWMPVDVDKIGFAPLGEVGDGVTFALQAMNDLKLRGRHVVWHLTNSHGFGGRWRIRLWVRLERQKTCADMKAWAKDRWGDRVDMAVYRPAQPIYTGDPVLVDIEPPVRRRVGCIEGRPLKLKVRTRSAPGGKPADDNVALLDEAGLYIGELRPGQHKMRCPWEETHTDSERDDDTFYFEPHYNGHDIPAFRCHHAHCVDRKWQDVLDELGVKRTVFSPVSEDDDTPPWVYVHRMKQFWDARDGALIDREAYDSAHGGTQGRKGSPTQRFMSSNKTTKVDMAEFLPGESRVVVRDKIKILNMYIDQRVEPDDTVESAPFKEHLRWLVPNEEDRTHLTRWLAWVYQHPGRKITWAPILYGPPGTGKTTVMNALAECIGRRYVSEPAQAELEDKFTDWAYGKLLVKIEELRSEDRFHVAEKLKPVVANASVSIRRMHETGFTVRNVSNVIASTNHMEALPMERGDRRYMLIQCCDPARKERSAHMRALWRWIEDVGYEGIASWLSKVDLSDFKPESEAPETDLKLIVMEASKTDFERAVDLCADLSKHPVVTSTALNEFLAENECKVAVRRLGLVARRLGWAMLQSKRSRTEHNHRRVTLWTPTGQVERILDIIEMDGPERNRFLTSLDEKILGGKATWQVKRRGDNDAV